LPEEVFIDSTARSFSRLSATISTSTNGKGDKSETIDILRDMQADRQHKQTKDDHWRDREEVCLERAEEHRHMEYLKEQECKEREEKKSIKSRITSLVYGNAFK